MLARPPAVPRPAAFLDRDGTIVEERHYLSDPAGVALLPNAAEALRRLRDLGLALVVVTNQSGIGRGLYALSDYRRVAAEVERQLAAEGVALDATHFCPDTPAGDPETTCRKPSTAMHRAAAAELGLDLGRSYYVGDNVTDVLPALETGGTGILVRTGYGREMESRVPATTRVVDDLLAASALARRLEARREDHREDLRPPVDPSSRPR